MAYKSALPGAARSALASSITNTQSAESGGLKSRVPKFGAVPIRVVEPLLGLNHQHLAFLVALVILLMSTVKVVRFPFGRYAMMVWPSLVLAVVVKIEVEPYPAVATVCLMSGTNSQCFRERKSLPNHDCPAEPAEPNALFQDLPVWHGTAERGLVSPKHHIGLLPKKLPTYAPLRTLQY